MGVAFALGDVDSDGEVELVLSGAHAPGEADDVRVVSLRASGSQQRIARAFAGGIAGAAIGDIDGDGRDEAVIAVRQAGSTRVELWTLN